MGARLGGFELLQQVRADAALQAIPVLLITSEASKDDVLQIVRGLREEIIRLLEEKP